MKKILLVLLILLFPVAAFAASPYPLVFEADTGGKYIYSNNPEFITRDWLCDTGNENARFIMNNFLTPGKYAFFASHVNRTERIENGIAIEAGFDIELDALFRASEDTTVTITALGFEIPKTVTYHLGNAAFTEDEPWGCLHAWADYLGLDIHQIDSGEVYYHSGFEPVTFTVKAGEKRWLSEFIENYDAVPFYRCVHIMADFEIESGECEFNVAALRSTGTARDRSGFFENAAFGSFVRDRQYKGVANSLNHTTANLAYRVRATSPWDSTPFEVIINNQKVNDYVAGTFRTHFNPQSPVYDASNNAESCMLAFDYYDQNKLSLYGDRVKEKDAVWHFDTVHNDASVYEKAFGDRGNYSPNSALDYSKYGYYHCNLGNYGVLNEVKYTIENQGDTVRYACYYLKTDSNNIVILRDGDGNLMQDVLCKGESRANGGDCMACVTLPPHRTTVFSVTVILTTNYGGGMENTLIAKNDPVPIQTYDSKKVYIERDRNFTGKEYFKWENRTLYLSEDKENWRSVRLDGNLMQILSGRWREYTFLWTGEGYLMYADMFNYGAYSPVKKFFKTVYLLDEDFNLKVKYEFSEYPTELAAAKGVYYARAGAVKLSKDFEEWEQSGSGVTMPKYNYSRFAASEKNGNISLSRDGINYARVRFVGDAPKHIESLGQFYYSAEGSRIYASRDGLYWQAFDCGEKVDSVGLSGGFITADGVSHEVNDTSRVPAVTIDGVYAGFENLPIVKGGKAYIPLRDAALFFGGEAVWNKNERTVTLVTDGEYEFSPAIIDSRSFVTVEDFAEKTGYEVIFDEENNTYDLTKRLQ